MMIVMCYCSHRRLIVCVHCDLMALVLFVVMYLLLFDCCASLMLLTFDALLIAHPLTISLSEDVLSSR